MKFNPFHTFQNGAQKKTLGMPLTAIVAGVGYWLYRNRQKAQAPG